jgi:hypothetical protein
MNTIQTASAIAAIDTLDLGAIKTKLMHRASGEGWSAAHADAVEVEYRRFLTLMKLYPNEATAPLVDVDTFWHYHILDTAKYAADCASAFGYFLHHYPYLGLDGEEDEANRDTAGARMEELYAATFGTGMTSTIPAASAWCGRVDAQSARQATAWCGAATSAPARQATAWCGAATSAPAQQATAWCGAATSVTAWCGAATSAPAQQATAWCGAATSAPAQGAGPAVAWCGAASAAPVKAAVAWCGAATTAPATAARAWCGAATAAPVRQALAWCGAATGSAANAAVAWCGAAQPMQLKVSDSVTLTIAQAA